MKANNPLLVACALGLALISLHIAGCASTAEQQQGREDQRKAEAERKQADQVRRHQAQQQQIAQKFAHLSTEELRVKLSLLDREVAAGCSGGFVSRLVYDGKVKEREHIAMEIVRRGESTETPPHTYGREGPSSGTGFFITDDGFLLSNYHVVKGSTRIEVKAKGEPIPAQLIRFDSANDLALLKATGSFHALPLTSSRAVTLGTSVFTIGFPNPAVQGADPKLTKGEVSSLTGLHDDPRQFQISVALQPGNSGGALVDQHGNVVGVVVARLSDLATLKATGSLPQNVNYAIKSTLVTAFLEVAPDVASKLKSPHPDTPRTFEEVVKEVEEASVTVVAH